MELRVELNWKSFLAIGGAVAFVIMASKANGEDAKIILNKIIDYKVPLLFTKEK